MAGLIEVNPTQWFLAALRVLETLSVFIYLGKASRKPMRGASLVQKGRSRGVFRMSSVPMTYF